MTHSTPLPSVDADVAAIREAITAGNRDDMTPAMLAGYFADANPARLERILTALTAAQARAEAVEKDAARYQCIRNAPYSDRHGDLYAMTFQPDGDYPVKGAALDAAADAAIAAIGGKGA